MSTRNLDALFSPASIALIGASGNAGSVGSIVLRKLRVGGYKGPILLVNPHVGEIDGLARVRPRTSQSLDPGQIAPAPDA